MKSRKQVLQFYAVSVLVHMAANFAHPVTPTLISNRGFGDYIFGVALASMMVANFLVSPFWGKIISIISSKKALLICCMGYAVGQALFGLAYTEATIVVARVFAGAFTAGLFIACLTYVVNTAPPDLQASYLTISATIQLVAASFGFFVGGMLGEIHENVAISAQVATLMVCGILFYIVCQDDVEPSGAQGKPRLSFKEVNPLAAFIEARHIMTPLYITIFAVSSLASLGSTVFDQSFNYYMKAQLGFSSGYNGVIKAVTGLVALVINGTVGLKIINSSDARKTSVWVYLLCSFAMLGISVAESVVALGTIILVYAAVLAVAVPLTQSLVASGAHGKDSNLIMGCYNGLKSLGGIFGALASGFLYTVNPKSPFVLGLLAFAFATIFSVSHYRVSQKERLLSPKSRSESY